MDPIPFNDEVPEVMERLKTVVGSMPRAKIVEESEYYLRVEFTTGLLRFVDDVELLINADTKLIHFRSASRIGHSDLGVNRKRMQALQQSFVQLKN